MDRTFPRLQFEYRLTVTNIWPWNLIRGEQAMSTLKGKPNAGGAKLGHSNQDHWEFAKKRRRHQG
jgi:hypothetical protein